MNKYQKLNNTIGWIVFLIATFTYVSTIEPTASFWDCGEYIADCFKLEVGHPPGAPLFLLIGRFFSLLAMGDKFQAAKWVNVMSALSSSFSILFLFWSITALAKKVMYKGKELTDGQIYAVVGAGAVGALAYTFSDSFWFSAVEGEVYAMSSFFTALVFWAILKWEVDEDKGDTRANRWLILIAYLVGLSIGVHLLNLLVIPAIVFVYYFKKFKYSTAGMIWAGIISIIILGGIQAGLIPWLVKLAALFELFFVNGIGLPFNSGIVVYFILLFGGTAFAIYYTQKHSKVLWNTVWISFATLVIGYSSFFVIVIRSQANPPMDENNPENAINLLSYLNREQYGDWPILYGQYYCAPVVGHKDQSPVYMKDDKSGKYIISDDRKNRAPVYAEQFCTPFPRMWSDQSHHVNAYKAWADIKGRPVEFQGETIVCPTFGENLAYFVKYQIGYMYLRYFAWNFIGRQNDIQGSNTAVPEGNVSAFPAREKMAPSVRNNKAHNNLYGIPLVLGIIGLIFHFNANRRDFLVVGLLFFFTGLAIVVYLNQYPYQPRERDYAYAASFYAFAIWIGFAVLQIYEWLKDKMNEKTAAIAVSVVCLLIAPAIMAKEEWDDHDRSHRYTARDFARDYLSSCAKNAILFTNGDNDTFPLWYVQEVEGFRTDIRIINLSLLNTDWYINQMKMRAYDSPPVPFRMPEEKYRQGTRDYLPINDEKRIKGYINLKEVMDFAQSEDPSRKIELSDGKMYSYIPTKNYSIPVDIAKVKANGTIPAGTPDSLILPAIRWTLNKPYVMKNDLLVLDLLANNDWERPIYFAVTTGSDAYMNLEPYFQLEGLAYRLVPVRPIGTDGQASRVNTEAMYENVMKKFEWGGMDGHVYLDENILRMTTNLRIQMSTLASALIDEGKMDKAVQVLDKCQQVMPEKNVPLDATYFNIVYDYYRAGAKEKANKTGRKVFDLFEADLRFYNSQSPTDQNNLFRNEMERAQSVLYNLTRIAKTYQDNEQYENFSKRLKSFGLEVKQ